MNTIKQKLGLAVLLAGSLMTAAADPVVFNVNMSVQSALGNFNAGNGDTVRVLGLDGDWTTGIGMVASDGNADIYTVTNARTALSYPNYKFVIVPASGSWIWESPASFNGNNRWFQVPAGGTNLPVVYFSDNTNMPSYSVEITFQVSMVSAIQLGNFTINGNYVKAFGSFDNWSATGLLLTNVPGTSNYVGTLVTTALSTNNTAVAYKYAIDGTTWEGNVGPNGAQNRTFTLTNTPQAAGLDYFNNITNVSVSYNVAFTLDMVAQTALGHFTPGVDTVYVNGDWDWSGAAMQLFQSGSNTNLFTNTVPLVYSPGTTVNYKYTVNGGAQASDWETNGIGPGGANNRQFVLNAATNLPADYYNNVTDLGPVTISQSGAQTILFWQSGTNANNRMRLQNTSSLNGTWLDVSGSEGQSSVTNNFGPGPVFFRVTGP